MIVQIRARSCKNRPSECRVEFCSNIFKMVKKGENVYSNSKTESIVGYKIIDGEVCGAKWV